MNIAMFADCYQPVINGVTTSIFNLKMKLEEKGHNVLLFAPRVPGYVEKEKNVFRLYSVTFPFQKEHRMTFPIPPRHFKEIKKQKTEIIHIHSPFMAGLMGLYQAGKNKIPAVFTHHTLWEEYVHYFPILSKTAAKKLAIALDKYVCQKAGRVIVPTQNIKELLMSQKVKADIYIASTGIELEKFKDGSGQIINKRYSLGGEKVLLYAGRIGREKGLDFLLSAFALVLKSFKNIKLFIAGDGPYRKNLEALAVKLNISKNVVFAGYVPQDQLKHFFARAHVFVFSSQTETQGLVVQEAMAGGLPSVAVGARGISDCIENNISGILTKPDIYEFSEKVLKVLNDESLQKRLARGALREVQKYSLDSMAEKIIEIYSKTPASGGGMVS